MLSIQCEGPLADCFGDLQITPVAISYEYDPCDVLKIPELKAISKEEKYEKKPGEDFNSILTGITGFKGRIHLGIGEPLNQELEVLREFNNQNDKLRVLGDMIDRQIYREYKLWPSNYMALDLLQGQPINSGQYSDSQMEAFQKHIHERLNKADLTTSEDRDFLLGMYANPVRNFEAVTNDSGV
jgi:hypothetical protein